jgi:hypothetical protein
MRLRCNGAKHCTEAADQEAIPGGRGAFRRSMKRVSARARGEHGRENAGMSNEKRGEIPLRRKPKVSWVKVICPGLVGP